MVVLSVAEFLWTCLAIFFMVIYFMMLFQVIVDVFRRHDASGGKKAGWLILLLIVPFFSLIITSIPRKSLPFVKSRFAIAGCGSMLTRFISARIFASCARFS